MNVKMIRFRSKVFAKKKKHALILISRFKIAKSARNAIQYVKNVQEVQVIALHVTQTLIHLIKHHYLTFL